MSFWIIAAAVTICSFLYIIFFGTKKSSPRVGDSTGINDIHAKKKVVLVLTAHPDDECMFFAPTILGLRKKRIEVNLLCMTTGGYDGMGEERSKELIAAAGLLGVDASHVSNLNHSVIQDGPDHIWDPNLLATIIDTYVKDLGVTLLITFDEYGVSGHQNHSDLCHGVRQYLKTHSVPSDLKAYKLISTSILRKYISLLDVPFSRITSPILFVSSWQHILTAQTAMFAHWSQLVWFRLLYIIFSRYMIVNTLERFDQEALKSSS